MIEVIGVQPTARELRPLQKGWGGVHWWACLPLLTPFIGLWTLAILIVLDPLGDAVFSTTVAITVIATSVAWLVARWIYGKILLRATRSAPGGGLLSDWTIGEDGLTFRTAVSSARVDWSGLKAVREEKDRVVFLLSPSNNPVLPKRQLSEPQLAALRTLIADVTASGRLGRGVD